MRLILSITGGILLTLALVLTYFEQFKPSAPRGAGQCYQLTAEKPQQWTLIGDKAKSIEECAGYIEALRTEKLKAAQTIGGYQGFYLIAQADGVYYTKDLKRFAVKALVHTDNGRLAPPGMVDACYAGQGASQTQVAQRLKLGACIVRLFDKVCLKPEESTYGSWSGTILRLQGDEVQQAGRDGVFRDLVRQRQPGCALPITD